MNHRLLLGLLLLAVILLAVVSLGQTAGEPQTESKSDAETVLALAKTDRFEGKATLKLKSGRPQEVSVAMRTWAMHGKLQVEKFPEHDFLIVYLHSGKVTTVIGGRQEHRKGGDFWTVPAGTIMSVQVTSESALLQTVSIKK